MNTFYPRASRVLATILTLLVATQPWASSHDPIIMIPALPDRATSVAIQVTRFNPTGCSFFTAPRVKRTGAHLELRSEELGPGPDIDCATIGWYQTKDINLGRLSVGTYAVEWIIETELGDVSLGTESFSVISGIPARSSPAQLVLALMLAAVGAGAIRWKLDRRYSGSAITRR